MRRVELNEIYNNYPKEENWVETETFLSRIDESHKDLRDLLRNLHHVDTHLCMNSNKPYWRVQGYFLPEQFQYIRMRCGKEDKAYGELYGDIHRIAFDKEGKMCITMMVPAKF